MTNKEIKEESKKLKQEYKEAKTTVQKLNIRNKIFEINKGLAINIMARIIRGVPTEDDEQSAFLGLIEGIATWCESQEDFLLSNYCYWPILNNLKQKYRDQDLKIKVPEYLYTIWSKTEGISNRDYTEKEKKILNKFLKTKHEDINNILRSKSMPTDVIKSYDKNYEEFEIKSDIKKMIDEVCKNIIKKFPGADIERDKKALFMHYNEGMTFRQIGKALGVTGQAIELKHNRFIRFAKYNRKFRAYYNLDKS